ncbi:facilitative glucose transporter GT1 [Cardiosporidium cionae]|uniref:Hexose transporter 1 n=1 Tax=Cardiosporidium cionae TaxID=476202 RepID=A0ABQ7JCP0_9APIC|nr:facilitative glucose transporter GT1 [Cardiosporidium cionae]|eukprot:KAF8821765.1 facilitative glucose transporter GT1 [Cardiosporidium cionae]
MELAVPQSDYDSLEDVSPLKYRSVVAMVANSLTASFLFGFSIASINPTKDFIVIDFNWCPRDTAQPDNGLTTTCALATTYGSLITASPLIGAAFGCLVGGRLVSYGRIFSILIMHFLFFAGNILSGLSEGVLSLVSARIILGLGLGLSTYCIPLYISEVTPNKSRGTYGVFHQLFITVGIVVANLIGLPLGSAPASTWGTSLIASDLITDFQRWWWRFSLAIPALLSIVSTILLFTIFNYDTPHFMIMKNQYSEAAALLRRINEKTDVKEEYESVNQAIQNAKQLQSSSISVVKAFQSSNYRHVIIIAFFLLFFQQITGINLLITNSNNVFRSVGLDGSILTGLSVGLTGVNVLMTLPAIFIIDRYGRRSLLIAGVFGQTVAMVAGMVANFVDPTSQAVGIVSVFSTFLFIISFAVAYGPVPWVFLHEIFPVEIKQSVSSTATAINWVGAILVVLPSDFYLRNGSTLMFTIFSVTNVIALICMFFFIRETKGRSIDDSPYFVKKAQKELKV